MEMENTGARPRTCVSRNLNILKEEEGDKKERTKRVTISTRPDTAPDVR